MKIKSLPGSLQSWARPLLLPLVMLSLVATAPVQAQEPQYSEDEPEIVIRRGAEGEVYYDYVVNGEVVEIKVVPGTGKPYYLVPAEGHDGYIRLDRSQLLIPKWVLFRW